MRGTNLYGFELIVASIGLIVTAGVVIYGIYAFTNHLLGIGDVSARRFTGELSIWLMATMAVWLPLTLFFYIRTRAETVRNPARIKTVFHKFVMGAYRFILLMTVIGLLFSVVFTAIRLLIGIDDNAGETVMRVIVPGLIGAVIASGFMVAYNRSHRPTPRVFSTVVAIVSVAVMIAVLSVSVGTIRDDSIDNRTTNDLTLIQNSIGVYYANNKTVPKELSDLAKLDSGVSARYGDYEYTRVSATRYQLCATFLTDTTVGSGVTVPSVAGDYVYYGDFYWHTKGRKCYNLTSVYPDDQYVKGVSSSE